jgi:hypothetical protein
MNTTNNNNSDNDSEDPWIAHIDSIQDITSNII